MSMPLPRTYCKPHRNGFRYRRRVPDRHQDAVGTERWLIWLGTDPQKALRKALALAEHHSELIAWLDRLTDDEREQVIAAGGAAAWRGQHKANELAARFAEVAGNYLRPDPETETEEAQAQTALEAFRLRERAVRLNAALAAAAIGVKDISPDDTPDELRRLWGRALPRSHKAKNRARLAVERFNKIVGKRAFKAVTQADVITYRDGLEKLGLKPDNVKTHLHAMSGMFALALSEGRVSANPFAGIKARQTERLLTKKDGNPFSTAQARLIFDRMGELPSDDQWVIRLCAYMGVRSGEAAQLRARDVMKLDGIDIVRISEESGQVKNAPSIRDVPIHPACRDLVEYARKIEARKGAGAQLFSYSKWATGGRGGRFQSRTSAFLRRIGITDGKGKAMHRWRHRFRDLCSDANMPPDLSRALMGHTRGTDIHDLVYGAGPSLKVRARWIAKVDPLKG